jgi:hypothetical protein
MRPQGARVAGSAWEPQRHVRPAGGAGRNVCTGRRRVCVAICVALTSIHLLMNAT